MNHRDPRLVILLLPFLLGGCGFFDEQRVTLNEEEKKLIVDDMGVRLDDLLIKEKLSAHFDSEVKSVETIDLPDGSTAVVAVLEAPADEVAEKVGTGVLEQVANNPTPYGIGAAGIGAALIAWRVLAKRKALADREAAIQAARRRAETLVTVKPTRPEV